MKRCILSTWLWTVAAVPFAYGKGPVDLILVSGGGLNQPIEITDSASLNAFNPWIGQFADWKAKPLVDAPLLSSVFRSYVLSEIGGTGTFAFGSRRFADDLRHSLLLDWRSRVCEGLAGPEKARFQFALPLICHPEQAG